MCKVRISRGYKRKTWATGLGDVFESTRHRHMKDKLAMTIEYKLAMTIAG